MRTVAIVGRPNVGKSALFNRLARRRISIVHDQPGVTRDRIVTECQWEGAPFTLIDTGGIGSDVDTKFTEQVAAEVDIAIETSDLLLFMVDAKAGLTTVDQALARKLRRSGKLAVLVVNKVDHDKHAELDLDFATLGFERTVCISAEHNRGTGELVQLIEALLPPADEAAQRTVDAPVELAIVGRPNVGKSSLINAILKDSRTLVSPISGTTRDAVDVPYRRGENAYVLIDTAGIRPRGKVDSSVEVFSVMRSERTIRRADLCVLVIDASAGVTSQDQKIAGQIQEAQKPCIVAVNKWDLVKEPGGTAAERKERLAEMMEKIRPELFFLDYAPVLLVSALQGQGMTRLFKAIEEVREGAQRRIGTGQLNRLLTEALELHPPPTRTGKRLKIVYATQPDRPSSDTPIPTPTVLLFVNQAGLLIDSYRKFLESKVREVEPWPGLPLRFHLREREARGRRAHVR